MSHHIKAIFLSSLCCVTSAVAGTMGDVAISLPGAVYVAAEGGWTWNDLEGVNLNVTGVGSIYTTKNVNRGSARVSMGFQKGIRNNLAALGEIGYGYYGKTRFYFHQNGPLFSSPEAPDFSQLHVQSTIDGFDVLSGFSSQFFGIDFSFKAGAMIENVRFKPSINLNDFLDGDISGSTTIESNLTQVLPEIKLGAGYQVMDNLFLTAAWMHVFGKHRSINLNINPEAPSVTLAVARQNPTINTFFLGASYAFPV